MNTAKFLDEAGAKLQQIFASSPLGDLEKNIKTTLAGLLGRLDLVSREEFEVQKQVLARTREKLERLEARLAELDKP